MNKKQFQRYLERDKGCVHCGDVETAVPHHRANRGMGGSKTRDVPSNIVSMCAEFNGIMESDSESAELARRMGWKLYSWQSPSISPVYIQKLSGWFYLDDEFNLKSAKITEDYEHRDRYSKALQER